MSVYLVLSLHLAATLPPVEPVVALDPVKEDVALLSVEETVSEDPFASLLEMDSSELRDASGGTDTYSVDLHTVGINISDLDGVVSGNTVTNSQSGDITDSLVTDNSGITTVFINSGNAVLFQNSLQINIYLPQ